MTIEVIVDEQKLTNEDKELIKNILLHAEIKQYNITNLKYYKFPDKSGLFISFGASATAQARRLNINNIIIFPALQFLHDKESNTSYREQALHIIDILKSKLETNKIFHKEIKFVPDITVEQLLQLGKEYKETGITMIDSNGKKIRIKFNENDKESGDKEIMFTELIAIKLAMDVLK